MSPAVEAMIIVFRDADGPHAFAQFRVIVNR
jgi:hypothetical protein